MCVSQESWNSGDAKPNSNYASNPKMKHNHKKIYIFGDLFHFCFVHILLIVMIIPFVSTGMNVEVCVTRIHLTKMEKGKD